MRVPLERYLDRIRERVGQEIFVSDWLEVRQVDVDVFAAVTRDWDYMHNDPQWATEKGPWGTTIAHGHYLLSLGPYFLGASGMPTRATADEYVVNYGLDKVRFTEPVLIGDRLRARLLLLGIEGRKPGRNLVKIRMTFETERRGDRPHMVADSLLLVVAGPAFTQAR
jgi:acyl dehydratase